MNGPPFADPLWVGFSLSNGARQHLGPLEPTLTTPSGERHVFSPDAVECSRALVQAHFARILKEYDQVNDQVHRAETNIEPVEQLVEVDLRKRRLRLKDEIAKYLAQV
jgi:uncharacterized protein YdcH (DUF465 family)